MPELVKQKKEKVPKAKPKKTKAVKTNTKKAKPPKAPKASEKTFSPKDKKLLVLLAALLMLVIIGAAIAIFLLTLGKRGKESVAEEAPKAPTYYFSEDEEISSITEIVGERDFKAQAPKKDEAASESTEDEAESEKEIYQYLHASDPVGDIEAYQSYLEGEKNFLDITDKSRMEEAQSPEASEEEPNIYELAGPSKDANYYLSITLETSADGYKVTTCKEDQPWNTYLKTLWNEQKQKIEDIQKKPKASTTIEQAEDAVRAQSQEKLGLPEPVDSYEYIATPGIVRIDGTNYYAVRTYKQLEDRTLIYIGTFLFNCDTNDVSYQYDEITGQTTPLG